MCRFWAAISVGCFAFWNPSVSPALETDQFLAWDAELEDSSEAIDEFLNDALAFVLAEANRDEDDRASVENLVEDYYRYVFGGLHTDRRIRDWILNSGDVDLYPTMELRNGEYTERSIYRVRRFPYILPLARTIRVGEIYFGTDKFGHLFGFGRRYFKLYTKGRNEGLDDHAAKERVVRWGIRQEATVVGLLVDGVFSHADLEANYQGLRLALDLSTGPEPIIRKENGLWIQTRPIAIRDYITPDFDESYNMSFYWGLRRRAVIPVLKDVYSDRRLDDDVKERFRDYADYEPSLSKIVIDEYFNSRARHPQEIQWAEVFAVDSD